MLQYHTAVLRMCVIVWLLMGTWKAVTTKFVGFFSALLFKDVEVS